MKTQILPSITSVIAASSGIAAMHAMQRHSLELQNRRISFIALSLTMGLGLLLSFGTAASAATCIAAPQFSLRQKDGFTVTFTKIGDRSATAFTPQYGTANASFKSFDAGRRFQYSVRWPHGEVGEYKIRVLGDNFGDGTVRTPGRNVRPVKFISLNPVVTGC